MLNNINFNWSWLSSWIIIERLIIISSHSKHIFRSINFIAKVDIVNFINITHIHVSFEDEIEYAFRSIDAQLSKDSQELHLSHMAVSCHIEVLKLGLQVYSSILHCRSILGHYTLELSFLFWSRFKIFSSSS